MRRHLRDLGLPTRPGVDCTTLGFVANKSLNRRLPWLETKRLFRTMPRVAGYHDRRRPREHQRSHRVTGAFAADMCSLRNPHGVHRSAISSELEADLPARHLRRSLALLPHAPHPIRSHPGLPDRRIWIATTRGIGRGTADGVAIGSAAGSAVSPTP